MFFWVLLWTLNLLVSLRKSGGEWDCCTLTHPAVAPGHKDERRHLWLPKGREALGGSLRRLAESLTSRTRPSCGSVSSLLHSLLKSTNGDDQMCLDRSNPPVCFLPDSSKVHEGRRCWWFKWRRNYYWRTMESSARWVNLPIKMLLFSLNVGKKKIFEAWC